LLCLSQEAYARYATHLQEGGLLIVDQDLVTVDDVREDVRVMGFPFTVEAERINRRIAANVIALGAIAVATGVVKPESIAKAISSHLPERNVPKALEALEIGVNLAKRKNNLDPD
jgi:2-oxoglutarate ferredoxin oxidoreductase subunit gamma